ncbi:hypothetical protein K491DRAFT_61281 [Lophiostoma macrostomum CBS 122681]|uniref:Uncharacterized protein n=1 Tax=Lophiostoma macrostomum CBS 122681 TaxID=1314788 RepID=A0A6A6TPI3_9PLEO|nr:hypothetical protein K491DRAFT_61281 [Lophiostoma macrostomum CBS 122681]
MNRFLTRKKDRVQDDNASGGKKNKKWKKGQPEPEPKLDLTAALPSTDDFRTSLIMPSLSTRFSMLREQDDPNSKLGKASDDSVLHPKRQSRLQDFGFVPGGLSDIAEVSSINGSIRPPFATERQNSFDSHATDDGSSVMSRARPGEGNILFGGRQKIYKISNNSSSKNLGRVLYDDDVNMSAFQKLRQQEKDRLRAFDLEAQDDAASEPPSPTKENPYSPSLSGFNLRRETSSSTNSGTVNTRSSTAATSIASQGANSVPASSPALTNSATPASPTELARSGTKARRLYDQALDQHMYDQQSSALNRLNSIQRTRAPTGRATPPLLYSQSRSATNLNDRFNRNAPFRPESPAMLNRKESQSGNSSPIISRPQSPPLVSPLGSDGEDAQTLNSALQPNDRGKATAMGAFNKPKQSFNEQQYAERLKQLQQEREVPPPKLEQPRKPSLRERAELEARKRAEAKANEQPRSNSPPVENKQSPSAFAVFQQAANQMRGPASTTPPAQPKQSQPSPLNLRSPDSQPGATFFASPGSTDDEDEAPKPVISRSPEPDRRVHNIPTASGPAPPIFEHPALRSRSASRGEPSAQPTLRSRSNTQTTRGRPSHETQRTETTNKEDPDIDSPTLGPDNGGLSGLIRQHLRNVSTVSSDYGESNQITMSPPATATTGSLSLQTQNMGFQRRQPVSESDTPAHSSYSHSNPWDLDDLDNPYYGEGDSISSTSPVDPHKYKSQTSNGTAAVGIADKTTHILNEAIVEWEQEMERTHKRKPSVEERDAFQRELALRQRQVQESLRTRQDHSRAVSPAPGGGGLKTALNMLRSKSSRESFATVDPKPHEAPSKAMKMLGIGANSANASSTSLAGSFVGDMRRPDDRFGHPIRQKPTRVLQQSEQDAQRELETRLRSATEDSTRDPRPKGRTPPGSSQSSTRDRSSSEVSGGRSRSRPAQYRDDLEQAMAEGKGSRSTVYPPNTAPSTPGYVANATQPLPAERPSIDSQGRMRSRSNSKTAAASYFESKHLQPIHTSHGAANGASPRLSPNPGSALPPFSAGLPASPRPSPGAAPSPNMSGFRGQASPIPPLSAHNTPPVSGTSTPIGHSFHAAAGAVMPSGGPLRKKSIAKADISEPIFLSTTSVIDTINLPPGASLKNGVDQLPPPVPPINPMRRRFGFGRSATDDPAIQTPNPPFADAMRTNSTDALPSQIPQPRGNLRKISSEGKSLHGMSQTQAGASPAMPAMPFVGRNGSPPRPINSKPITQQNMDGAMF